VAAAAVATVAASITAVVAAVVSVVVATLFAATAPPPPASPLAIAVARPLALVAWAEAAHLLGHRRRCTVAVDFVEILVAVFFERRGIGAIPQKISLLFTIGCIRQLLPRL
jgi:hypothetical protein